MNSNKLDFLKVLPRFEPANPICKQPAVLTVKLQNLQTFDELWVCYHALRHSYCCKWTYIFHNIVMVTININKTLDDSVIVKQLFMFRKNLTNQNECTQMRIDFDYKGFHKWWTLQIKIDANWYVEILTDWL